MSLWRDEKFLLLVSNRLQNFKKKKAHEWNFRCPLCGDSERNRHKARGYIYAKRDILFYKCHNCSVALPFAALLKRLDRQAFDEYLLESLQDGQEPKQSLQAAPEPHSSPIKGDQSHPVDKLLVPTLAACRASQSALHEVYRYAVEIRKLPESALTRLNATNKAHTWLLPLVGEEKAAKVADDITYLVQPFCLPNGAWYGAQLRMLERKEYLTFRWSNEPLKMFGLEAWNPNALTYVVEGPIDSLFIPNCISPCGSDLLTGVQEVENQGLMDKRAERVYVWDNEPKNPQVRHHIQTAIRLKEPVVIWRGDWEKDINDMVRAGKNVLKEIEKRTFKGTAAQVEFDSWAR